ERECREEDGEKDVEHALLRVLGADLHNLLAVRDRRLLRAFQMDVRLDELDRAVTACMEAPANQKITAPPQINPSMKGACRSESFSTFMVSPWVRAMMIEKVI